MLSVTSTCSGHGKCTWGSEVSESICSCDSDYYGSDCAVLCTVAECLKSGFSADHVQCNSDTGACECVEQWAGVNCDDCSDRWYGINCDRVCSCNKKGKCDRSSGQCECYADVINGYWSGSMCDVCLEGYSGPDCNILVSPVVRMTDVQVYDETYDDKIAALTFYDKWKLLLTFSRGCVVGWNSTSSQWSCLLRILNITLHRMWAVQGSVLAAISKTCDSVEVVEMILEESRLRQISETNTTCNNTSVEYSVSESGSWVVAIGVSNESTTSLVSGDTVERVDGKVEAVVFCSGYLYTTRLVKGLPLLERRDSTTLRPSTPSTTFEINTKIPHCVSGCTVSAVGCDSRRGILVMALEVQSQIFLSILNSSRLTLMNVMSIDDGVADGECQALYVDSNSRRVFVALGGLPPFLNRLIRISFEDNTLIKTGTSNLRSVRVVFANHTVISVRESLAALASDGRGVLYGLHSDGRVSVSRFLMIEVTSITPHVADIEGQPPITLHGVGFSNIGIETNAVCSFDGSSFVVADSFGNDTAVCTAPKVNDTSLCPSEVLEVSLVPNVYTASGRVLLRKRAPSLNSLEPAVGTLQTTVVTVSGSGFDEDSCACKFSWSDGGSLVTKATFVTSQVLLCEQPKFITLPSPPLFVDVSIDAFTFHNNSLVYSIAGYSERITITPSNVVVGVGTLYSLPPLKVMAVDKFGTRGVWNRSVEGARVNCYNNTMTVAQCTIQDGGCITSTLLTFQVTMGLTIRCLVSFLGWGDVFYITVKPGEAWAVVLRFQPSETAPLTGSIVSGPVAAVQDRAGNRLISASLPSIVAAIIVVGDFDNDERAKLRRPYFEGTVDLLDSLTYFNDIVLYPVFGVTYRINITCGTLIPVVTREVVAESCGPHQYAPLSRWECQACPLHALCNGSSYIEAIPGYWRSDNVTTTFYSCDPSNVCVGNSPQGDCLDGHRGVLCASCAPPFVHDTFGSCVECQFSAISWIIVIVCLVVVVVAVIFLSVRSLVTAHKPDVATIVFPILFGHIQTLSLLGDFGVPWPDRLFYTFHSISIPATLGWNKNEVVDCLLNTNDNRMLLTSKVSAYLPLIIIAGPVSVVVYMMVLKGTFPSSCQNYYTRAQQAMLLRKGIKKTVDTQPVETVAPFSVFTHVIVTTTTHFLLVLSMIWFNIGMASTQCYDIDSKEGLLSYLKFDFSTPCDDTSYSLRALGVVIMIVVAAIFPAIFFLWVKWIKKTYSYEHAKFLFAFLMAGLKEGFWFWQIVNKLRREFLIIVIFTVYDPTTRVYYCMWGLTIALIAQLWCKPYTRRYHNLLEECCISASLVSLNLGLLFFLDIPSLGLLFVEVVLIISNVVFILALVLFCVRKVVDRLKTVGFLSTLEPTDSRDEHHDEVHETLPSFLGINLEEVVEEEVRMPQKSLNALLSTTEFFEFDEIAPMVMVSSSLSFGQDSSSQ